MIPIIKSYIETLQLLTPDKPVIVGFSGGSDSVALIDILNRLGYKCIASHCNFHLRNDESIRDESFCRSFAAQHAIDFEKIDFDTKTIAAQKHISVEMAARELRYEWFESLRKKHDAQAIAIAHHQDDSNETILLNLIRGTGIRGLCGIRPKNGMIVRPLLCVGKDDINLYINEQGLSYVTDSSNLSDDYTRNYIRLRLIPLMKEVNPSIEASLSRTAEQLADVESIYLHTIEKAKKKLLKKENDDVIRISIGSLSGFPAPKTILYELLQPFGFTSQQVSAIFHSLLSESGKRFDAPDGEHQLLKDRDFLFLYKKAEKKTETFKIEDHKTDLAKLPIRLTIRKIKIDPAFEIDKSSFTATFDAEKIKFPLILRRWKSGDWFVPFGLKGRQKISDFFSDHKFSRYKKDKTWLLCDGNDIIWIVGERTDNRFRIDNQSKFAFVINFSQKN